MRTRDAIGADDDIRLRVAAQPVRTVRIKGHRCAMAFDNKLRHETAFRMGGSSVLEQLTVQKDRV
ncbi:hypothetical protein GCM10022226_27330 [Sphaerisporangium flaviroseum]|uniref:Uncharacterized protein n=1 Tax=Sphaerisporangium flaviroseum TaxID=509199 RepID=A0ABP7I076_9ACTN